MGAGYRLVIIRVRDGSVDGLRRAAITLERLMGVPERDAFIGLDRLPFPARGGLRLEDAQLYIKALRTAGLVAQVEPDGTDLNPARPSPPRPVAPAKAPIPPRSPVAAAPVLPPLPPRTPPAARPALAPPASAAPTPRAVAAEPAPERHAPTTVAPVEPPDELVTRPYPIALVEDLVEQSASRTPAPREEALDPPRSSSCVIDLGDAAAPGLVELLPMLDVGELPSPSWDPGDLTLDAPLALDLPAAPARDPGPREKAERAPATDLGLDLSLLDEGPDPAFDDLTQPSRGSPHEVPPLSLDDFDPLK